MIWFKGDFIFGTIAESTLGWIFVISVFGICLISGFITSKGNEKDIGAWSGMICTWGLTFAFLIISIIKYSLFSTPLPLSTLIGFFFSAQIVGYPGGRIGNFIKTKFTNKIKNKA